MQGPDGTDYDNLITYREVAALERIAYSHGDGTDPKLSQVVVTFTLQLNDAVEGAKQTLDRLEAPWRQWLERKRKGAVSKGLNRPSRRPCFSYAKQKETTLW